MLRHHNSQDSSHFDVQLSISQRTAMMTSVQHVHCQALRTQRFLGCTARSRLCNKQHLRHRTHETRPRQRCFGAFGPHATAGQTAEKPVYKGMYGDWSVEDDDVREVIAYRAGLNIAALALLAETAISLTSSNTVPDAWQNAIVVSGAAGVGVSLYLVHMYVTPIKRFIQALYSVGLIGALGLMLTQNGEALPQYVLHHPSSVWLVGPFFAALTGLAFKEGACYGKLEAIALFFVTPLLLLGHLTSWVPEGAEKTLLIVYVALFTVFAGRKWTQAIKDDIGDKSIFTYQALPIEKQQQLDAERGTGY